MSLFFQAFQRGYVGHRRAAGAGRPTQTAGRHTVEYVTRHGGSPLTMVGQPADGMQALGAAGRQSLDDLYATPIRTGSLA
jgi:hypothetical protein